jgi:opacity protein-like surface antigen
MALRPVTCWNQRMSVAVGAAALLAALVAPSSVDAQTTRQGQEARRGPDWYFVGGAASGEPGGFEGPSPRHGAPVGYSGGFAPMIGGFGLSVGDDRPARHEFVLVLSNRPGADRVGLAAGQSLSITLPRDSYTFLVNRSIEVDLGTAITPHFMAGLGLTYQVPGTDGDNGGVGADDWRPAFQVGVGASYDVTDQFAITARLRAFYLGAERLGDGGAADDQFSQDFFVGARIRF